MRPLASCADEPGDRASLHAHVAKYNVGSIRVLVKCGFSLEREESGEVPGEEVAELVLVLR